MADEQARLKIVTDEKQHYLTELLDYNKRLDRTVSLYISAVYAAIGLHATGKLDLSALILSKDYHSVWIAFLFIFLNACIVLHGIAQSSWCMSIAKFIHLKLDCELLPMTGKNVPIDRCKKSTLHDVDVLGWDDWRGEIKGVAINARTGVFILWAFLILTISVCSLTLVNVPLLLKQPAVLGYPAIAILILIHGFISLQAVWYFICCQHYHDRDVIFQPIKVWSFALVLTVVFVGFCWYAATHHL